VRNHFRSGAALGIAVVVMLLWSCGGGKDATGPVSLTVPKAENCAAGDRPETGLQGQVPAALRATGFSGFNCNLQLLGQFKGEGGSWSAATFKDRAGHTCAYYATGYIKNMLTGEAITRVNPGVPVIDITDPAKPVRTMSLTTPAMMDPWESLRVNPRRQVLAADFGSGAGNGGPEVDFYDLSGDCRNPQLLSSTAVGTGSDGGITLPKAPLGHEGNFAPDGLTYYVGDAINKTYNAVDVTNMTKPKVIAQFDMNTAPFAGEAFSGGSHGLSVSDDGNRAYFVSMGNPTAADLTNPNAKLSDGFYIVDTSEVQARKPNATMKLISATSIKDGSVAQHTVPFSIAGKSYLVFVDEGGSAGISVPGAGNTGGAPEIAQTACSANLAPFPMARIFDISDESHPQLVSKLMLETHDPANCAKVIPDLAGLSAFTYGSHYCSVDNRHNATALACAYFNSGVRVFDIRDPQRPKEIAYYNPAGSREKQAGSAHTMFGSWRAGGPDVCASRLDFDFARHTLTTMCQDNGLLVMKFENNVWPMPQSTPTLEQTN
jgi:hypothetical protein